MTPPKDIEALMTAVRALVSARVGEGADPLVLTSEHRIGPEPQTAPERDDTASPVGDAVLRDFARLTLIAAADAPADDQGRGAAVIEGPDQTDAAAPADLGLGGGPGPDLTELRAVIRDILRDELRDDMGRQITDSIHRLLREELDRRADSAG
ncbi:MAG: hypothetical protein NXH97_01015 [Rhodobacteraceae bacterium]|nr:hypothetical protein [Paracoccaceae bacterium]